MPPESETGVTVTQIDAAFLARAIGRLEGKIDVLMALSAEHAAHCDPDRQHMRKEIAELRSRQSWMLGVGATLFAAASAILAFVKGVGA